MAGVYIARHRARGQHAPLAWPSAQLNDRLIVQYSQPRRAVAKPSQQDIDVECAEKLLALHLHRCIPAHVTCQQPPQLVLNGEPHNELLQTGTGHPALHVRRLRRGQPPRQCTQGACRMVVS
jgi:hypothetical protein